MSMLAGVDWFPLWLSLRVAAVTTVIVITVGTLVANLLAHRNFRGRGLLDSLITLPLVLPPTVLGYYLLVLLGRNSWIGRGFEAITGQHIVFTWQAAVIAACLHSAPIYIKAARAVLKGVDARYARAARSLGASAWRTFWQVTLPLAGRDLTSLAALTFARSLGDFGVTLIIAGNIPGQTQTVAVAIYDAVESGNGLLARVLVIVVSAVVLLLLWPAASLAQGPRRSAVR